MTTYSQIAPALLALATLSACRAPTPASDARAVEELAPTMHHVDEVLERPADPGTPEEARRKLGSALTEDSAVELALTTNRSIRAALHEIGMARGAWMQSRLLPNPVAEVEILPERESLLELRLEYDLTAALLAPARAKTTAPRVEAARLQAAEIVVNESAAVRQSFIRLQAAEARLELARGMLETFSTEREAALALTDSGNVPELKLSEQTTAHERARSTVAQWELAVLEARESLISRLGLAGADATFQIVPTLREVPPEPTLPGEAEQTALRKNFSLLAARKRLEGSGAETAYLRTKGNSPDVNFDIHLLWQDPNDDPPGARADEWRVGGGLSTTIPLFNREQGSIKMAESAFDAQMERLVGSAVALRSAVRRTAGRILSTHARFIHLSGTVLPAQRDFNQKLLEQYNAMQVDVFALLRAKRTELELEQLALSAREEFLLAQVTLDAYLMGGSPELMNVSSPTTFSTAPVDSH